MSIDATYFRLERVIGSSAECFLCALEEEIERKYIDAYLSELVMDAKVREKIVESKGFCNHHSYKMLIMASKPESPDGHGIALTMQNIIEKLIQDLRKHKKNLEDVFTQTWNEKKCPACVHIANFMKIYDKKIVELLSSNHIEFLKLLKKSKGLCIPHFTALIREVAKDVREGKQDIIYALVEVEERNLLRLNQELSEYVKMQSYEFSDEHRKDLENILLRSIQRIAGRREINFLPRV
ncbi:MAG: DUF6062 family protein [Candidatus Bathyarchaeales archaeon]